MATIEKIEEGIRRADMAGDSNAVQRLGAERARLLSSGDKGPIRRGISAVREFVSGPTNMLRQGLSFGTSDELQGVLDTAIGSALGQDTSYSENVGQAREDIRQFRDDAPIAATASEILGGVATAPFTGAARIPQAAQALPAWMKAAGVGAAYGGAYGAGTAEGGLKERAVGAGVGAGVGAATGAIAQPVGQYLGRRVQDVGDVIATRRGRQGATRSLARAMARDETTPGRMSARLRELGPQASLSDAGGENVLGLARGAASTPGVARNRATQMLNVRQEGELNRIATGLRNTLSADDYFSSANQFLQNLKQQASPFYTRAYEANQSVSSRAINRILETPAGKVALRRAATKMRNDMSLLGRPDKEMTAALNEAIELGSGQGKTGFGVSSGLKLRTLDYVKRSLNDMADMAGRRGAKDESRIIGNLARELVGELDSIDSSGAYAKARQIYADDKQILDALEEGTKFLGLSKEQIGERLSSLSDAGKKAFRSGAVRSLLDRVESTADMSSAARRIFGNQAIRDRLRAVMPDRQSYTELARRLVSEQRFTKTRQTVLGGSQTQPRLAEQEELRNALGTAGTLAGATMLPGGGNPGLILAQKRAGIGRRIAQSLAGEPGEMQSRELARLLFNRNQTTNQATMSELLNQYPRVQSGAARNSALAEALLRATAQQEGRLSGSSTHINP